MIEVIVFYAHVIFLVYIFTKTFLEENLLQGVLSAVFIVILFSVGWVISELIMSQFMPIEGVGRAFPRSAFSLLLLAIIEIFFYKFYYGSKKAPVKAI
ncbi:MAG: hypothetical protein EHM58_16100 [Ignavibacteriae bacterium]|nr:MAG: hypothetical protein EHM58_16100 [Ignavibacteriota bacterium]